MQSDLSVLSAESASQQPEWLDRRHVKMVREALSVRPPLVGGDEVRALRSLLARVAVGEFHVLQSGDCAEDPAECTPVYVARKVALLDVLAGALAMTTGTPVLRVGRIAGQFGKPRSKPTERVGGVDLPVYRGHMVNGPEPDALLRQPDPERLLTGYEAASAAMDYLRLRNDERLPRPEATVWTSHEALLLDYELPMLRQDELGRWLLTSTHWPWIGNRTNQVDGAHATLLATIENPVACKVGPGMAADELVALCERLDPFRTPGRLTLIARMGAGAVAERLPPLVAAVRAAGHPVVWLTDPMHGNTVNGPDGLKTRFVETVVREVVEFQRVVSAERAVAGGLHLETTPDDVTECVADESAIDHVGDKYTSFCDPRLNPKQAIEVVSSWR
ncbi:3-deoxy-7-phosphoheptulonate synthase [Umezawaea beigongshangensis]|uniref:3-deoxy-7-phosphoheptulonate synthase n=1 Tax=Umezawaea beigongshangensis TaxID=2780383 RepID=UPI0027DBEECA|nr:3-deoxy-7-phosphoheptulonate synthase [Umezawaea beigongshangensis]